MSLVSLLILLIVVGLLLWVLEQIPMDAALKRIIRIVAIVIVVLYLLSMLVGVGPVVRIG